MKVCEEMQKLRKLLDEKNITWIDNSEEFETGSADFEMWICRTKFESEGHHFSVINGFGTYGGWYGANSVTEAKDNLGQLELMIDRDEPIGWLTAEEVIYLVDNLK